MECRIPLRIICSERVRGGATIAEKGASEYQLMAIYARERAKQARGGYKKANRKRLGADATDLLVQVKK